MMLSYNNFFLIFDFLLRKKVYLLLSLLLNHIIFPSYYSILKPRDNFVKNVCVIYNDLFKGEQMTQYGLHSIE